MNDLLTAAAEIHDFCLARNWRFCIIGGREVARWGQPRATQDVGVSLLSGLGREDEFISELLNHFQGRLPDTHGFARESRVVLAQASNGVAFDIALAAFPFEEQVIDRATSFEFADSITLITVSAEDLVVLKAFAGRDQDWSDVQSIVTRSASSFDWDHALRELTSLSELRDDTSAVERLSSLQGS